MKTIDEYDKIFLKCILIIIGGLIGLIISMRLLSVNSFFQLHIYTTLLAVLWAFITLIGIAILVYKSKELDIFED